MPPAAVSVAYGEARAALFAAVEAAWVSTVGLPPEAIQWPGERPRHGVSHVYWMQVTDVAGLSETRTISGPQRGLNTKESTLYLSVFGPKMAGGDVIAEIIRILGLLSGALDRATIAGTYLDQATGPYRIEDPAYTGRQVTFRFSFWEAVTGA